MSSAAISTHERFMRRALELAHEAQVLGEVPVGSVVVVDGEIIGEGFNQPIAMRDPSAHSEMLALRAAAKRIGNYRLVAASLYVTIEPCMMCCGALVHSRIDRLVFGAREPRSGVVVSNARFLESAWHNHSVQVTEGILAEACGDLMRGFFQQRRREAASA